MCVVCSFHWTKSQLCVFFLVKYKNALYSIVQKAVSVTDKQGDLSMSMEWKREENRRIVTTTALKLFLEKGIDCVTTKDIARACGLTDRSVYRYFDSRIDLVLQTAFLFWSDIKKEVEGLVSSSSYTKLRGIDQINIMLEFYSTLFITRPESVRYILGVEMLLSKSGVVVSMKDRPPGSFDSDTPLANAIRTGIDDGSVSKDIDAEQVYYLAYDSILGLMQRHVLGAVNEKTIDDPKRRMEHLCAMLIAAFEGRI